MDHPSEGRIRMVGPPSRRSLTSPDIRSHPPRLGENTREILAEIGFAESEIDDMLASGAAEPHPEPKSREDARTMSTSHQPTDIPAFEVPE